MLTVKYFLDARPGTDFQYTKYTLLLIGILFALSIAIKIYRRKYVKEDAVKKIIRPYSGKFFTFGVILLFLLFAREAGIPFFSMRILWLFLLIYIIGWIAKTCFGFKKEYKKRTKRMMAFDVKTKYLPKKKK